jgi:hypothetical protein
MTACGASLFLRADGPNAVPLRACCAAAIVHAAGPKDSIDPAPFVCADPESVPLPAGSAHTVELIVGASADEVLPSRRALDRRVA